MKSKKWTRIITSFLIALSIGVFILEGIASDFPRGVFFDAYSRVRNPWGRPNWPTPQEFFANDPSWGFHHLDSMNANWVLYGWENGEALQYIRGIYPDFQFDNEYRPDTLWCYTSAQKSPIIELGPDYQEWEEHCIQQGNYSENDECRTGGKVRAPEIGNKWVYYALTDSHDSHNWLIYPPDCYYHELPIYPPPSNTGFRWDGMNHDELHGEDRAYLHYRVNLYAKYDGDTTNRAIGKIYLYETGNSWDIGPCFPECGDTPEIWSYGWWSRDHDLAKAMNYEEQGMRDECVPGIDTIWVSDFSAPNTWQEISLDCSLRYWHPNGTQLFVGVYWTGFRDFYIDWMTITNQYYDSLFFTDDSRTPKFYDVAGNLGSLQSQHENLLAYFEDEPWWNSDHTIGELNQAGVNMSINFGHDDSSQKVATLEEVNPPWFYHHNFPFWNDTTNDGGERWQGEHYWMFSMPWVDSASTLGDGCENTYGVLREGATSKRLSLQFMWDHIINANAVHEYLVSAGYMDSRTQNFSKKGFLQTQHIAEYTGIPWYAVLQSEIHSEIDFPWSDPVTCYRFISEAEMFCQANIALAHGAKGIVYYTYAGYSGGLIASLDTLPRYEFHPTERYGYVKNIFAMVDEIGPVLSELDWCASVSTRACEENKSFPWQFSECIWPDSFPTYLESVESFDLTHGWNDPENADDSYVQIAVFRDGDFDSWHLMFVNRRCLLTEHRGIEYKMNMVGRFNEYFVARHYLSGQTHLCESDGYGQFIDNLILDPGRGELIHIYPVVTITDLTAMVSESNIILNWSPPERSGEITYEVFGASDLEDSFQSIGTTTETTFTDAIGTASKRFYRVAAFNP